MKRRKFIASLDDLKKDLFKDSKFVKEYEALGPEFAVIEEIIKARAKRGMTQEKLAKKMKTKQSVISRLENGNANPSLGFLKRLAKALDLRMELRFKPV